MSHVQGQSSFTSRPGTRVTEPEALDPLLMYESGMVGREFDAFIPGLNEARDHEIRRSEVLLKTWRGVPSMKDDTSTALRHGLAGVRDFEYRNVVNTERMIIIILTAMTIITGLIVAAFMASM